MNKALRCYSNAVRHAINAREQKRIGLLKSEDVQYWKTSLRFWGENTTFWRHELRKETGK